MVFRMKSRDLWAEQVKRNLEQAGYKVTMLDPKLAIERKKAGRRRDRDLIASGKASREEIQRKNSVVGPCANGFRILDYGCLGRGN
jgi:hypothetical protein